MARKSGSSGEKTRVAVQEAAVTLFAKHGFAAVSMRQIASAVGVQAGALYLYTPDKQTLLYEILKNHMEHLLAAWAAENVSAEASPELRLEQFVRFHIAYHIERPERVFISYMELRNLDPDNFSRIEVLRREYEQIIEGILVEGQARGCFVIDDARLTTMAMIAMLTGVSTWYREGGRLAPADIAQHYVDMAFRLGGGARLAHAAE